MPVDLAQFNDYIGDGVYASFDGYYIWLKAGGMENDDNAIALEPTVFAALLDYQKKLVEAINET